MGNRLTFYNNDGSFGVAGMNANNQDEKLYSCVYKLMHYENTELSPDEVEDIKYQVEDLKKELSELKLTLHEQ